LPLHLNGDIHYINGFPLPLIYGLAKITRVEAIMWFWQVCKVAILKYLSWFLICLGVKFQSSFASIVKNLTLRPIMGLRNVQINYGEMLDLHDLLFQDLTQLIIPFFFRLKDHDKKPIFFPFQHTWIWNSLFKLLGITSIFFLCLSSLTQVYDIE
jgi:hypothetical protein